MNEQWKPIPSWSGYEASSEGRIRNADGQVLSQRPLVKPKDYAQVYVNGKASGRKSKMAKVAHLVAEAFIGPRPEGLVINHLDGVKENNRPSNLEYCTVGENNRHAFRIGLQGEGYGRKRRSANSR